MKLTLGCGQVVKEGYVHHDLWKHSAHVDVAWDLDDLPWPWPDESAEEIHAYDVLEHLTVDVIDWMEECWRILQPDGKLDVRVPHYEHENFYTDPTHQQFFAPQTFEYWDPSKNMYRNYGQYHHARSGHLWRIEEQRYKVVEGNLYFVLRKIA